MTWTEWAHDVGQAVPASLISRDWREIDRAVSGGFGSNFYTDGAVADMNSSAVYPVQRTGTAPDQWYERDEANDVAVYVAGGGGLLYEITQAFAEMDYTTARRQARDILENYFMAYDQSVFTLQGKWFSADDRRYLQYTKTNNRIRGLMTGTPKVEPFDPPEVVFDVNYDANLFTLLSEWEAFCRRLDGLSVEARTTTLDAWQQVQAATTTDEVRQIIAALPPIPEPV